MSRTTHQKTVLALFLLCITTPVVPSFDALRPFLLSKPSVLRTRKESLVSSFLSSSLDCRRNQRREQRQQRNLDVVRYATPADQQQQEQGGLQKAPAFNGKVIYPLKVFLGGLKGHTVAAVYAIVNSEYKRG